MTWYEDQKQNDADYYDNQAREGLNTPEPDPISNNYPAVWELVIADMKGRDEHGRKLYGTPLQPHNGRNALVDAYQEALDLAVYLRQKIFEESGH